MLKEVWSLNYALAVFKHFKKVREHYGLSQLELADQLGISKNGVAKWELDTLPGLEMAIRVQNFFQSLKGVKYEKEGQASQKEATPNRRGGVQKLVSTGKASPTPKKRKPSLKSKANASGRTRPTRVGRETKNLSHRGTQSGNGLGPHPRKTDQRDNRFTKLPKTVVAQSSRQSGKLSKVKR